MFTVRLVVMGFLDMIINYSSHELSGLQWATTNKALSGEGKRHHSSTAALIRDLLEPCPAATVMGRSSCPLFFLTIQPNQKVDLAIGLESPSLVNLFLVFVVGAQFKNSSLNCPIGEVVALPYQKGSHAHKTSRSLHSLHHANARLLCAPVPEARCSCIDAARCVIAAFRKRASLFIFWFEAF